MDRAGSGGAGDRRGLDEEHCPAGGAPGEPDPDPTAERSLGSAERERRAEDLVRRGLLCLDYDPTAALRMAERALESDPANTNARLLLGRACRMRDEQALRETLARRADDLYADGRLEEAIQTWERLLVLDPPDRRELDIRIRTSRTLAARVAARGEHAGAANRPRRPIRWMRPNSPGPRAGSRARRLDPGRWRRGAAVRR